MKPPKAESVSAAAPPGATTRRRELHFLVPEERTNLRTVFGGAGLVHAAFLLLLVLAVTLRPVREVRAPLLDFDPTDLVFLEVPGPGGGGGGGGNMSPEPPKTVETPPVKLPEPEPEPVPDLEPEPLPEPEPVIAPEIPAISPIQTLAVLAPSVNFAPASLGPGTAGGAGQGDDGGIGPGQGPGLGPGEKGNTGGGPSGAGSGVEGPRLVSSPKPSYTSAAMLRRIEGIVELTCVVTDTGSVTECKTVRSLDPTFGLDEEAHRTAQRFRFLPGTRSGEPVAVPVRIEIIFNMR